MSDFVVKIHIALLLFGPEIKKLVMQLLALPVYAANIPAINIPTFRLFIPNIPSVSRFICWANEYPFLGVH